MLQQPKIFCSTVAGLYRAQIELFLLGKHESQSNINDNNNVWNASALALCC